MKRYSQRFALGLLAGTVFACHAGWGVAQETATPAKPLKTNSDSGNQEQGSAPAPRDELMDFMRSVTAKIRSGEFKEAYEQTKKSEGNSAIPKSMIQSVRGQLLNQLIRTEDDKEVDKLAIGKEFYEATLQESLAESGNPAASVQLGEIVASLISKEESKEATLEYLNAQREKVLSQITDENRKWASVIPSAILLSSLQPELGLREAAELDSIYAAEIAKLRESVSESGDMNNAMLLLRYWTNRLVTGTEDQQTQVTREMTEFSDSLIAGELSSQKLHLFNNVNSMLSSRMSAERPREAKALLESAIEKLKNKEIDNPRVEQTVTNILSRMAQLANSYEAAIKQTEMVGKAAPAFDAEHWVNGEAVTLADLKGKVVLVDFWAIWCGPCIATFPELRKWHAEYSDKGLVILGVTRQYGYVWDEESKSPTRPDTEEEVPVEEELDMLTKFIQSYELPHATMVTPKTSTMNQDYAVTGIPHVALLDKQGNVALIQVGAGPQSAKRIHEKIEELLAQ